jgi:hypothetical protein
VVRGKKNSRIVTFRWTSAARSGPANFFYCVHRVYGANCNPAEMASTLSPDVRRADVWSPPTLRPSGLKHFVTLDFAAKRVTTNRGTTGLMVSGSKDLMRVQARPGDKINFTIVSMPHRPLDQTAVCPDRGCTGMAWLGMRSVQGFDLSGTWKPYMTVTIP